MAEKINKNQRGAERGKSPAKNHWVFTAATGGGKAKLPHSGHDTVEEAQAVATSIGGYVVSLTANSPVGKGGKR